ncbi:hypothetical protein SLEP1_g47234 [Rubroshorea leprosula]|uniref:Uncharacterized protein n=1 Tax=Rubroshorea leprosula TaxID=152421 RepID=A0AAV5LS07_9ROSI|nr:hypothetical protein SLEP1_g47234 [Rubroshorea leprosula]
MIYGQHVFAFASNLSLPFLLVFKIMGNLKAPKPNHTNSRIFLPMPPSILSSFLYSLLCFLHFFLPAWIQKASLS